MPLGHDRFVQSLIVFGSVTQVERARVLAALGARFTLLVESPPTARVVRFRLEPLGDDPGPRS